jgi:hypothetical protein
MRVRLGHQTYIVSENHWSFGGFAKRCGQPEWSRPPCISLQAKRAAKGLEISGSIQQGEYWKQYAGVFEAALLPLDLHKASFNFIQSKSNPYLWGQQVCILLWYFKLTGYVTGPFYPCSICASPYMLLIRRDKLFVSVGCICASYIYISFAPFYIHPRFWTLFFFFFGYRMHSA